MHLMLMGYMCSGNSLDFFWHWLSKEKWWPGLEQLESRIRTPTFGPFCQQLLSHTLHQRILREQVRPYIPVWAAETQLNLIH